MPSWKNKTLDYPLKRNKTENLSGLKINPLNLLAGVYSLSLIYKIEVDSKLDKNWF